MLARVTACECGMCCAVKLLEAQPGRQRHAFAEGEHFARAERGHEADQRAGGVRHRGAHDRLVAVVRHAHRKQGRALRNDGGVELGRALRDQPEEHAVFAAFLGDARHRLARRPEADRAVGRRVAMRLLAHDQQRERAVAPKPELERHAQQHRDDRVHHLGREAGELHDGHRHAVRRQAEQLESVSTIVSPPTLALSNMKP